MNLSLRRKVLAASTAVLLALLCGCTQVDEEHMPGKMTTTEVRPPQITSQDGRIESFFLSTVGNVEFQKGSVLVDLDRYDPNDTLMQQRIGDNPSTFKEKDYVLFVHSFGEEQWDDIKYVIAVDESFLEDLTDIVRQSVLYTYSGQTSWSDGLPPNAGESIVSVTYASGASLSNAQNGMISDVAQDLTERVRPLLIQVLEKNHLSFLPLLNIYHSLPTPTDWVEGMSLRRSHETKINTYSFQVSFSPSGSTFSGDCQDHEGMYHCENVVIEEEEAEYILGILREAKFLYRPSGEPNPEDDYDSSVNVTSRTGESFQAVQGIETDLEAEFTLMMLFFEMTKKYSE